MENINLKNSGQ